MPTPAPQVDDLGDVTAVVPAGGVGTRLWPLSRAAEPKFLHDLTGEGRSLLQSTVDRLEPLVGDRVMVVTGTRHAAAVRQQLPALRAENVLVEPSPRDSMPAIGLAAAVLERHDPDAVLASFAADHVIGDLDVFADRVRQAARAARTGALVTLGITPTYPATGFGYVRVGAPADVRGAPDARRAAAFVEKPDARTAEDFLASGDHLWNAGMFVVRATVLLEILAEQHPGMVRLLRQVAEHPTSMDEVWGSLTKISIDHAVAEPAGRAGRVVVVPAPFAWDDVGDFASLATMLADKEDGEEDGDGLVVLGERRLVVNEGSTGLVAARGGRTVVTLGVDDVVVVDTPDALLVTTRQRCQDVRGVVSTLQRLGREDLT